MLSLLSAHSAAVLAPYHSQDAFIQGVGDGVWSLDLSWGGGWCVPIC